MVMRGRCHSPCERGCTVGEAPAYRVDGGRENLTARPRLARREAGRLPASRADEYASQDINVYDIGDSRAVGNIMTAIWEAYEVARGL